MTADSADLAGPRSSAAGPARAARPWPRAVGWAAAAVYVPALVPLVATDLRSCDHCLGIYARRFPVLLGTAPGFGASAASGLGEPWEAVVFFVVAGLSTLAVLAAVAFALRRGRKPGIAAAAAVALFSAWLSLAAAATIRA